MPAIEFRNPDRINFTPVSAAEPLPVTAVTGGVVDSAGGVIYPDSYAQVLTYGADGVSTIAITDGTNTWTQTFTYTAGQLTGISKWVKT